MNDKQKKDAEKKFKKYQKENLTTEDIEKAESRAHYLGKQMSDFNLLLEMFNAHRKGIFKINRASLSIIIGAIIYVISPLDAIPDMIPVLGWIDDISIIAFAMSKVQGVLNEYLAFKKENNLN